MNSKCVNKCTVTKPSLRAAQAAADTPLWLDSLGTMSMLMCAPGLWNCECCEVLQSAPIKLNRNKVQTKQLTLAPALLAADKIICEKEEISIE